jgi:hypothetical protein
MKYNSYNTLDVTWSAPDIADASKAVEYFGIRNVRVEYAYVVCRPNNTDYGCTACADTCGTCFYNDPN